MAIMIVHGYQESWTTIVSRAVGPTTRAGARGTLPVATDLTARFVAPVAGGGNDANAGTQAAPKATINAAFGALAGRTIICISPGPTPTGATQLSIIETVTTALAANKLFATTGYEAIITATTAQSLTVTTGEINGCWSSTNMSFTILAHGALRNCGSDLNYSSNSGQARLLANQGAVEAIFDHCIGQFLWLPTALGATLTMTGCILVNPDPPVVATPSAFALYIQGIAGGAGTYAATLDRCLLQVPNNPLAAAVAGPVHSPITIADGNGAGARTYSIAVTSSPWNWAQPYLVETWNFGAGTITNLVLFDHCWLSQVPSRSDFATATTTTFTVTNPLDSSLPLMLTDAASLSTPLLSPEGARLQVAGKTTPDGTARYGITSPLHAAGVAGVDVAPWSEATTGPTPTYLYTTRVQYPPSKIQVEQRAIGPVEVDDLAGNHHVHFDGIRKIFTFQFGSDWYTDDLDLYRLMGILQELGTKKLYPKGTTGNLFAPKALDGVWSATSRLLEPNFLDEGLANGHWIGFWVELDGNEYYCEANDDTTLTLLDVLGVGYPINGSYDFAVRYVLVQSSLDPATLSQQYTTTFTDGGDWAEPSEGVTRRFPYSGLSITFLHVQEPDDGVS